MPDPLPLPTEPPAGVLHLREPLTLAHVAANYGAGVVPPAAEMLPTLARHLSGTFETQVAPLLALDRPWNGVQLGGQTILQLPIRPEAMTRVAALLAPLTKEGSFGAVRIPRTAGDRRPTIAYLDPQRQVLTLAHDLRGIATGYALESKYGEPAIRVRLDAVTAAQWGVELPFEAVDLVGAEPHRVRARFRGVRADLPGLALVQPGALTGMLESPLVTLGASTRYAEHAALVADVHQQIRREIADQSVFIRGTLEDLFARFVSLSRQWNGRVMLGVAPARHVMIGLGTADARAAGNAALHLVAGVLDNLKLAQTLGVGASVPDLRFGRDVARIGAVSVHELTVRNALRYLPRDLAPLLDERGDLKVAWGAADHTGGMMMVTGTDARAVLGRWLVDVQAGTAAAQSEKHLAAATVAVNPAQLQHVFANPYAVLQLKPTQSPLRVVVERLPDGYEVRVQPG